MKRLFYVFILLFVSNVLLAQNYVTLYTDCNYRGTAQKLYPGRYSLNSTSVGVNSVSSIRVPNGFKVVVYDGNEPGTGNKTRYTYDMSCLPRDWNDRAMSVVVESDNSSGNNNNNNNNSGGGNYNNRSVMVYSNCQYGGSSKSFGPGSYNTAQLSGVGNDQISSIQIPSGWQIIVYADDNWRGSSRTYYSSISCVDNSWNDRISSFRIYSNTNNHNNDYNGSNNNGYDDYPSRNDGITVFEDCYYAGRHYVLRPGRYDSREMGIGNDRISSIKVPSGYRIIAYGDGGFSGGQREFYSDVNCLGNDWNDKISSIEVIKGSGGGNYNNNNNNNYYPSDNAGVTFYEKSWFGGQSRSFGTGNNEFYNDNLDRNVSSIKIESGYTVTVWDEPGYRGNRYSFSASSGNLNFIGWNDRIRSFSIRRN